MVGTIFNIQDRLNNAAKHQSQPHKQFFAQRSSALRREDLMSALSWAKMRLESILSNSRTDQLASFALDSVLMKLKGLLGESLFDQCKSMRPQELKEFFSAKEPVVQGVGNALLEQIALLIRAASSQEQKIATKQDASSLILVPTPKS